jgi:hypothetical protein
MKKHIYRLNAFIIITLVAFTCVSCFEIVEEINLNDDGSGSFCFTINMSQSKLNINSMLLLDSVNGRPVPKKENVRAELGKVEAKLKEDLSITNVAVKENWEEYIFSISGNFNNIETLNKAINDIGTAFGKFKGNSPQIADNFSYHDRVFARLYNYNLQKDYNSLSEKDKVVFNNAKYTAIYRFNLPVKSFSNVDALKSKSGKALMLKLNIKDMITSHKTLANTINLK